MLFDGVDGHVPIPSDPELDNLLGPLSVATWIRITDVNAGWRRVFVNNGSCGAGIWQDQLTLASECRAAPCFAVSARDRGPLGRS